MGQDQEKTSVQIPLLQKFYDSPLLLMVLGIIIMFVFYTGWGLLEILSLPQAPLP